MQAKAIPGGGVTPRTLEPVNLRASQINGCAVCAVQHPELARKLGESDKRLSAVGAWREAPYFDDPVPDEPRDVWNRRLNVVTRQVAGQAW